MLKIWADEIVAGEFLLRSGFLGKVPAQKAKEIDILIKFHYSWSSSS